MENVLGEFSGPVGTTQEGSKNTALDANPATAVIQLPKSLPGKKGPP